MFAYVTVSQFMNVVAQNNICTSTLPVLCIGDLKNHTFLSQLFLQSASRVVW